MALLCNPTRKGLFGVSDYDPIICSLIITLLDLTSTKLVCVFYVYKFYLFFPPPNIHFC